MKKELAELRNQAFKRIHANRYVEMEKFVVNLKDKLREAANNNESKKTFHLHKDDIKYSHSSDQPNDIICGSPSHILWSALLDIGLTPKLNFHAGNPSITVDW